MIMTAGARHTIRQDLFDCLSGITPGLSLNYQPIYDFSTGKIARWEGLIRWHHHRHGLIGPSVILQLVKDASAEFLLLSWVIEKACAAMAGARSGPSVAINMHSSLLTQSALLLTKISTSLSRHNIRPGRLELEITEDAAYPMDAQARSCFKSIQDFGIALALDDFGTGFAGLSVLRDFGFDRIKLDKSFMLEAADTERSALIMEGVAALARSLEVTLTAEGIETTQQLRRAKSLCLEGQGFLLGKPVPADAIAHW